MSARGVASAELLQHLQRQVKSLTVEKLKKILRNSSLAVTGTKPVLVEKIINGKPDHDSHKTRDHSFWP